ncbi:hypothetical protein [Spongiactinospora sp. TRM90649]|uniref:hypothetical protein n=1 Tax=Spongiactinospora sp. TRM90649 TaxID=3031114 RepID=UPI0023F9CD64|nr:hypothetical protein [Spongiactinospora sp. TRM90649]MDF5757355.1 hypothetical protein [Spongiactinospora sp. TRM90649]
MSRLIKAAFIAVALTGAFALTATVANALPSSMTGTHTSTQYFTGETDPWTAQTYGSWGNIPTAVVTVNVPAGTTRFVDARFTAESLCAGTASAWCSVRIVVVNSAGTITELQPVTSTDYRFDSPGGAEEAHALERFSAPLGAGTYTVRVQALRMTGITQFILDDYAFTVGLVERPVA